MGICMSSGVIRDFAGPYLVGEGNMAFGRPTRYLQLNPKEALGGDRGWDQGVIQASETYSHRVHNLFCDNCHSHVATALDHMRYSNSSGWNMIKLAAWMFVKGKYVGYVVRLLPPFLIPPWLVHRMMLSNFLQILINLFGNLLFRRCGGFLKTWLPFLLVATLVILFVVLPGRI